MAELGYVYGRDFVTEPRGTDRLASIVDLVGLKVDVIVATGGGTGLYGCPTGDDNSHHHDRRTRPG